MADLISRLRETVPVRLESLRLDGDGERTGLVIVDEVNGFAAVGYGHLAPPAENPHVTRMIAETGRIARAFAENSWPILAFLDTHEPGKEEPPYPPHCEKGTGEEELVDELKWLESEPAATLIRKDCINGFIGATAPDGRNALLDWVREHSVRRLLVVGICTDICVMDFVLTILSARNHGMMSECREILVHEGACATYDLPAETAKELGLPPELSHPQDLTHHMGLYFMASRGARLVGSVEIAA